MGGPEFGVAKGLAMAPRFEWAASIEDLVGGWSWFFFFLY